MRWKYIVAFIDNLYFVCWKVWSTNYHKYFPFWHIYFIHGLSFVKFVRISNIDIIRKGAHLNFVMGATLHRYATD